MDAARRNTRRRPPGAAPPRPRVASAPGAAGWRAALMVALMAALALPGCGGEHVSERYGRRTGLGGDSVNGTAVMAQMLEHAGHRVRSVNSLYPSVAEADVIVWFCDGYAPPSAAAQGWLESWLAPDGGKTLVYVARDYEAGPLYWAEAARLAPAGQQGPYRTRLRGSRQSVARRRAAAPVSATAGGWFTLDRRNPTRRVRQLSGPWAAGIDASACGIEHRAYLTPAEGADILLADGRGRPLVSEVVYGGEPWQAAIGMAESRLVLVENGSFLLNAALVNREHRKLAGRLIDSLGPPPRDIALLETGPDPAIRSRDPSETPRSGLAMFGLWPIGAILAQALVLGILYAASRWPIFGRPRSAEQPSLTDFRRHVAAVGRLLAATGDRAYAEAKLRAYFHAGLDRNPGPGGGRPTAAAEPKTDPKPGAP